MPWAESYICRTWEVLKYREQLLIQQKNSKKIASIDCSPMILAYD